MNEPIDWDRAEELFEAAMAAPPDERASLLDVACAGDALLRATVESLVRNAGNGGDLVDMMKVCLEDPEPAPDDDDEETRARDTIRELPRVCEPCRRSYPAKASLCVECGGALADDFDALVGKHLDGRFRIEALVGKGGMGAVYRASDAVLRATVAVKLLPPVLQRDADWLTRFKREGYAGRALQHRNAVAVHDMRVSSTGLNYLVLEYVEGATLKSEIGRRGRFTAGEALDIIEVVAGVLDAAHALGIVHRDVKPDNVMLAGSEVKVLDFGIAKLRSDAATLSGTTTLTHTGDVIGTASYMAPEQWGEPQSDGDPEIDGRADVYSLGIVAYEMLTGVKPFRSKATDELRHLHVEGTIPSPKALGVELDRSVMRAVGRALEKDRADRFRTAGEFARALRAEVEESGRVAHAAEALRLRTLGALAALAETAKRLGLPDLPPPLVASTRALERNRYRVLVLGEAKRGKSTLVNSLIGRELLPSDLDVATCQVFRVRAASRPSYRLVFEDGRVEQIPETDLAVYGSQTKIDEDGEPPASELLKWIDVEGPFRFLPDNVEILDTPGVGSLYAPHAAVVARFVPEADAVVFVLDSDAPIGDAEISLLETALGSTEKVFFVQTKIDQHKKSAWHAVLRRNEEILRTRLGDRLAEVAIRPISSRNLLRAATASDPSDAETLELVSRHREMTSALREFLFVVSGWGRAADAVAEAERFVALGAGLLAERLEAAERGGRGERAEVRQRSLDRARSFEREWARGGRARADLLAAVRNEIELGVREFERELYEGRASIEIAFERIRDVTTMDDARRLAPALTESLLGAAFECWSDVWRRKQRAVAELLRPLSETSLHFGAHAPSLDSVAVRDRPEGDVGRQWWQHVKAARSSLLSAAGLAGVALVTSLYGVGVAVVAWKVAAAVREAKAAQLREAKEYLRRHVEGVHGRLREHFFGPDSRPGERSGAANAYARELLAGVTEAVESIVESRLKVEREEARRLAEEEALDDEARAARRREHGLHVAEWDVVARTVGSVVDQLRETYDAATGRPVE